MIIKESFGTLNDGTELQRTYSDQNKYIRKIGTHEIYAEAVDIAPFRFEYEETDMDIEPDEKAPEEAQEGENATQATPPNRGDDET